MTGVKQARQGRQVFQPSADHPQGDILVTEENMYYVYVIQSEKDGTTYIGYTEDLERRIKEHNQGKTKSIKHKIPYRLIYKEAYETKTEARKREIRLKKNSFEKEKLFKAIFA